MLLVQLLDLQRSGALLCSHGSLYGSAWTFSHRRAEPALQDTPMLLLCPPGAGAQQGTQAYMG